MEIAQYVSHVKTVLNNLLNESHREPLKNMSKEIWSETSQVTAPPVSRSPASPPAPDPGQAKLFREVLAEELKLIRLRREHVKVDSPDTCPPNDHPDLPSVRKKALGMDLVGLSFSGGGIRSATFSLGVLQGLARYDLLNRFDYLSTVSGGGYIGCWLTAWIKREGVAPVQVQLSQAGQDDNGYPAGVENVERQLDDCRIEQAKANRAIFRDMTDLRGSSTTSPSRSTTSASTATT